MSHSSFSPSSLKDRRASSSCSSTFEALETLLRQRHERSFAQLSRSIARHNKREQEAHEAAAHHNAHSSNHPRHHIDTTLQPCVGNVSETKDSIRVLVDLPGVYARDISVTIDTHGVLCLEGCRKFFDDNHNKSDSTSSTMTQCIKKQRFMRRYAIDTEVVDYANATATLSNGVLTFRAPKKPPRRQVIRIPVVEVQDIPSSSSSSVSSSSLGSLSSSSQSNNNESVHSEETRVVSSSSDDPSPARAAIVVAAAARPTLNHNNSPVRSAAVPIVEGEG